MTGQPQTGRAADASGFFAADSMVRRLHAERLVLFSGARALLMQACDPLAVIGFERHSTIFDDPRTRLRRTDEQMSRIYFGTDEQAQEVGRAVRAMHQRVSGCTTEDYGPVPKGTAYSAADPKLGLWVLASLADSAVVYYERFFGRLTAQQRESYWSDYRRVGALLGLPDDSMPSTYMELQEYVRQRLTDGSLWVSPERREIAKGIVLSSPFNGALRAAVLPLHETIKLVSVGMLPSEIRKLLGLSWDPAREALLRSTILNLRIGARFWPEPVRLHPAARTRAGEIYGAITA